MLMVEVINNGNRRNEPAHDTTAVHRYDLENYSPVSFLQE